MTSGTLVPNLRFLFALWYFDHRNSGRQGNGTVLKPMEREVKRWARKNADVVTVDTSDIHERLGSPTTPEEVDMNALYEVVHGLNCMRIRNLQRGVMVDLHQGITVTVRVDDVSDESEDECALDVDYDADDASVSYAPGDIEEAPMATDRELRKRPRIVFDEEHNIVMNRHSARLQLLHG